MSTNKIYNPKLFVGAGTGGGLDPADQEKLDHISITTDINLDTIEQDLTAVKDSVNGISKE